MVRLRLYGDVRKLLFIGQFDMWIRKVENIEEHIGNQVQTLPFAPYSHARSVCVRYGLVCRYT